MNTNTKFPNHHLISSNKFGFVFLQVHNNVIKPSQVPIEEKKKEESPLTDDDEFTVYADMSFYSKGLSCILTWGPLWELPFLAPCALRQKRLLYSYMGALHGSFFHMFSHVCFVLHGWRPSPICLYFLIWEPFPFKFYILRNFSII